MESYVMDERMRFCEMLQCQSLSIRIPVQEDQQTSSLPHREIVQFRPGSVNVLVTARALGAQGPEL